MTESGCHASLSEAESACRAALQSPGLAALAARLPAAVGGPEECYAALGEVTVDPASTARLEAIQQTLPVLPHEFEQWLLVQAALAGMKRAVAIPVSNEVKAAWAEVARMCAEPSQAWLKALSLGHVRFHELARVVTWRRFPAGQFHWEVSGFPRSTLLKLSGRDLVRVLRYVGGMGGFSPTFATHVNDLRKNRLTLTEAEAIKSYYQLARSMALQPAVRGLVTCSWLYCPSTCEVTPRLAWLREFFVKNGGVIASAGPAASSAGFLVGSEERRKLYEQGLYRPTNAWVLWSRRAILEWAARQE